MATSQAGGADAAPIDASRVTAGAVKKDDGFAGVKAVLQEVLNKELLSISFDELVYELRDDPLSKEVVELCFEGMQLSNLYFLEYFPNLTSLTINSCSDVAFISCDAGVLSKLEVLNVYGYSRDLFLQSATSLKRLDVRGPVRYKGSDSYESCKKTCYVNLPEDSSIQEITLVGFITDASFHEMKGLTYLALEGFLGAEIKDRVPHSVRECKNLETLSLRSFEIDSWEEIGAHQELEVFVCKNIKKLPLLPLEKICPNGKLVDIALLPEKRGGIECIVDKTGYTGEVKDDFATAQAADAMSKWMDYEEFGYLPGEGV